MVVVGGGGGLFSGGLILGGLLSEFYSISFKKMQILKEFSQS